MTARLPKGAVYKGYRYFTWDAYHPKDRCWVSQKSCTSVQNAYIPYAPKVTTEDDGTVLVEALYVNDHTREPRGVAMEVYYLIPR